MSHKLAYFQIMGHVKDVDINEIVDAVDTNNNSP